MVSPMNSRRTGCGSPAGKMSTMPPRIGEFALLVSRIFAGEACIHEQVRKVGRRDVLSGLSSSAAREHALGRGHARQQRRRRSNHDSGAAVGDGVKRARAGGRHADVRRQTSIGIDLVGGEGQDRPLSRRLREPFERREEERDVGARLLQVRVGRDDVEHDAVGTRLCRAGDKQRFRRRREPRHHAAQAQPSRCARSRS